MYIAALPTNPIPMRFARGVQVLAARQRRPDVRSLRKVAANTPGHVSLAMLAGIQNPCPVGERDINALLPKRRAELGRKLTQHGLDGRIGEMTEVRVDRFARE